MGTEIDCIWLEPVRDRNSSVEFPASVSERFVPRGIMSDVRERGQVAGGLGAF